MGNEQSSGANIDDLRQHNVPIKLPPAKPGNFIKTLLFRDPRTGPDPCIPAAIFGKRVQY